MFQASETSAGTYIGQHQSVKTKTNEKIVQYVNRIKELENKFLVIRHSVTEAEQKRVLLRGLKEEHTLIYGVIRAADKTFQEAVGFLIT